MCPQNYRAFFFDLDNTLFNYEASFKKASLIAFASVFSPYLDHPIQSEKWFQFYKTYCDLYWPLYENQALTREQYQRNRLVASLVSYCNYTTCDYDHFVQFQTIFEEKVPLCVEPFPWAAIIIDLLGKSDYEFGVISNGNSSLQREKLSKLGLKFLDRYIYISSEISLAKPSPDIFTYVQSRSRAKQYFYCGDSLEFDILPAVEAGWTGIWWNPEQRKLPLKGERIHSCHNVNELIQTIKKYIE